MPTLQVASEWRQGLDAFSDRSWPDTGRRLGSVLGAAPARVSQDGQLVAGRDYRDEHGHAVPEGGEERAGDLSPSEKRRLETRGREHAEPTLLPPNRFFPSGCGTRRGRGIHALPSNASRTDSAGDLLGAAPVLEGRRDLPCADRPPRRFPA